MRQDTVPAPGMPKLQLVTFNNARELADMGARSKHTQWRLREREDTWAGGSFKEFMENSRKGDPSYARKAEKYVENFSNLAIQDYAFDMDYNTQIGVLDYHAAQAGNPACMFGPTVDLTEKSPVHIYVDAWTSATVKARAMEMRGVAVLSLAIALSMFRPVMVKLVTGLHHSPTRTDMIQIVDVPTAPMDLSMASWMLGSPTFFRWGILNNVWAIAKSDALCGVPRLSNASFQQKDMANWLAEKDNVHDVVFLPLMFDNGQWGNEKYTLDWIKQQLARFVE